MIFHATFISNHIHHLHLYSNQLGDFLFKHYSVKQFQQLDVLFDESKWLLRWLILLQNLQAVIIKS
jgi:hypothetical protein